MKQEVTPQGSFPESEVWTGSKQFRYVDAERLDPYDEDSWLWHHFGGIRYVVTVMSVAEMKALNCGDDLSVEIRAFLPSQLPPVA